MFSKIYCSVSSAFVNGVFCTGGLIGENLAESKIINSYCTGDVFGEESVGGLVGRNLMLGFINNCYSIGDVTGGEYFGGLIGSTDNSCQISNSFWDINTSNISTSAGGTGKTTEEMKNVITFTNLVTDGLLNPWDFYGNPYDDTNFEDIWDINENLNDGYPFLWWQYEQTSVNQEIISLEKGLTLKNAYPNPFNPLTRIDFNIENGEKANLEIFNVKGQLILRKQYNSGFHSYVWSSNNCSTGVYFYRLRNNKYSITKKMIIKK